MKASWSAPIIGFLALPMTRTYCMITWETMDEEQEDTVKETREETPRCEKESNADGCKSLKGFTAVAAPIYFELRSISHLTLQNQWLRFKATD